MNKLKKVFVVLLAFALITMFINLFATGSENTNNGTGGNDENPQAETIELSDDTIIF